MKKILVPIDFSKPAQTASDVASSIARKGGASIVLLHIVEQVTDAPFNTEGEMMYSGSMEEKLFMMKLIEKSKKKLELAANRLEKNGVKVKQELIIGRPYHAIAKMIVDHKVDLVVMGTAGHSKLERMLIGTNTERVVRHAKCPVLTIHQKPATLNFKNIVYATAMSEDEERFSTILKRAQQMYDSTLHLVFVNTPANFQRDAVIKKRLEDFAKKLQLKNFTLNIYNDLNEEEGVIYFSESINADMIAMATHGRTGFAHMMAGSIAENVVGHSRRPVFTFVVRRN